MCGQHTIHFDLSHQAEKGVNTAQYIVIAQLCYSVTRLIYSSHSTQGVWLTSASFVHNLGIAVTFSPRSRHHQNLHYWYLSQSLYHQPYADTIAIRIHYMIHYYFTCSLCCCCWYRLLNFHTITHTERNWKKQEKKTAKNTNSSMLTWSCLNCTIPAVLSFSPPPRDTCINNIIILCYVYHLHTW